LAAEQNAAVGIGMSFDPFDPAPTREKLLNGFLARHCIDLGRHDASPLIACWYAMPLTSVSGVA
jgi:hypothetical protein